ncbi:hypothetical protein G6F24_017985 [Rhizopus arrhizus]|nr:hypothetical protein G6F24_017985 [Rhizopus arrhizus]
MKRSSAARDSMRRADRCGIGSKPSWRTMRAAASRALSSSLARYGMEMVVPGGMRSASARNAGRAFAPTSSEYLLMKAAAWAGARADITRPRARCWRWACCRRLNWPGCPILRWPTCCVPSSASGGPR